MNRPDFDEFAALWHDASDPDEQERIGALARSARRRGRLLAYADVATGGLLVLGVVLGFVMQPGPATAIIAGLLIAATLWANWKRRALRQMTSTLGSSDRGSYLEIATRNANANLRRLLLSLYLVPIFALMAILFKLSLRQGGKLEHPLEALGQWAISTRGIFGLIGIAVIIALLLRSRRKVKAELRRLENLGRDYRDEAALDEAESR